MSDTPRRSKYQEMCTYCGFGLVASGQRACCLAGRDVDALERELSAAQSRVREVEGNSDKAIGALVKLECQCPYDPGAPGKPAILLGPLCHRCVAIKLLSPKVSLQDAALADNERLRKDAERYRWLRTTGYAAIHLSIHRESPGFVNGPGLDSAIDAALAEQGGGK